MSISPSSSSSSLSLSLSTDTQESPILPLPPPVPTPSSSSSSSSSSLAPPSPSPSLLLSQSPSYDDWLESQLTDLDVKYISDSSVLRQLMEFGFRSHVGQSVSVRRNDFERKKKEENEKNSKDKMPTEENKSADSEVKFSKFLFSSVCANYTNFPFLHHLAEREELVRSGKLTCILFLRHRNSKGHEVSGFIDFGHRMKTENFVQIFLRKKKLLPKPSDLSFYNWETGVCTNNSSQNFVVKCDINKESGGRGMKFKNQRDRKIINVDPNEEPGDNTTRIIVKTKEYLQCIIYDHQTRRKT